jgi:hypothetical protein
MGPDSRNVIELLNEELSFLEDGGYGRSVRTPWQEKSVFQDSLTCLNSGLRKRIHPCSDCHLLEFVAPADRGKDVPCHFIHLNNSGETIEELQAKDNQAKLEREVSDWLRKTIKKLEDRT